MNPTALIDELRTILGAAAVVSGDAVSARHDSDWTGQNPHRPAVVLLPNSTAQVSAALRVCHAAGQPVVVQGGLTGLAGGATPQPGEVALSLERLSGIEDLDTDGMTLTVKAGTPLQVIQDAAADRGLDFPLDLGARGSCQIGGNVATNAGGNQVIRYGMTRALVLGLEAVLADGTVISAMNQLLKNNAGMDLKQMFIGSEGQLGVVTRLVLRLVPRPAGASTALCAVARPAAAIELLRLTRQTFADTLNAYEVMWSSYYQAAMSTFQRLRDPFDRLHPAYVLIEVRGNRQAEDAQLLEDLLAAAFEQGLVLDATVAGSLEQAARLWEIRDAAGELIPVWEHAAVFDIGIPIRLMVEFVDTVERRVQAMAPGLKTVCFGHIGDGNLHYMAACRDDQQIERVEQIVYEETGRMRGSVSAEHGIGVHKMDYLHESRSPAEIELMRRLKVALDPKAILNRGRVMGPP